MPPYKPVVSKSQSRKLFALAERGELAMSEARGKTRAAKGTKLPERVHHSRGHSSEHSGGNRYAQLRRGK